jgi:hypothetical protein
MTRTTRTNRNTFWCTGCSQVMQVMSHAMLRASLASCVTRHDSSRGCANSSYKPRRSNRSLRSNTDSSEFSNDLSVVCQGRFTHRITEVTKKASNSFDQARPEHPPSPAKPAIGPPSFPCRPGSLTLIDDQLECLLIEEQARHGPRKGDTKGDGRLDRSTSIFCMIPCTDCLPVRCSLGDNRHAPRCCPPRDI